MASAAVCSNVSIMLLSFHCWLVLPVCVCGGGGGGGEGVWSCCCDLVIHVLSRLATGKEGAGCLTFLMFLLLCGCLSLCLLCLYLAAVFVAFPMRGTRGGDRVSDPHPPRPEQSQKYKVSYPYWSGSPSKSQSYQASIR